MKSRSASRFLITFAAFAASALSLSAQVPSQQHTRYRLIQIGTFGGPGSGYQGATLIATNSGMVVGVADTSDADPNAPICFNHNCLVSHAWKWQDGVLTDLGVLPGGGSSYTNAINYRGLVVGQSEDGTFDALSGIPRFVATLWDHGLIKNLGTFGGISFAISITNENFIMGASENGLIDTSGFAAFAGITQTSQIRAFGWNGGEIFDLGTLGGLGAFPLAMNNRGQVVGLSPTSPVPGPSGLPPIAPFLWSKGEMLNLGTLGGTLGMATAINESGRVVGFSNLAGDSVTHAFLWEHGAMTDLGTIGGTFANANWLNDAGEVIGFGTNTGDVELHAFIWSHGAIRDLGTVAGDNASNAFGINNRGQVVGQSWFFDGQQVTASHAFFWEDEGPIVDLNTLIANSTDLFLTEANFITDRGWIVANGFLPNGDHRAAILIPEEDADNLHLALTPTNGESTLKPVPPRPDRLTSLQKPLPPRDYHLQSLTKYSVQLHGYAKPHRYPLRAVR